MWAAEALHRVRRQHWSSRHLYCLVRRYPSTSAGVTGAKALRVSGEKLCNRHRQGSRNPPISRKMEAAITKVIPNIDPVISEYSIGYLKHASASTAPDADQELQDAINRVTALLYDAAGGSLEPGEVSNLIEKLASQLVSLNGAKGKTSTVARKLDQTIHMASQRAMSATVNLMAGGVDLEATNSRKVESKVDKKKLEKAERKIKAKQDKKIHKTVEYEASKLIANPDSGASYEEFFMQVNPLQIGSAAGKSKDVKIDNVDVSISGKRILSDTSLTLAYGRRYGLVGQNGIGKSTLLRALSRRELAVPKHITILHVEQEVGTLPSISQ